jgi:hypothetical protein
LAPHRQGEGSQAVSLETVPSSPIPSRTRSQAVSAPVRGVYWYIMRRTQIYVDESQDEMLAKQASAAGVTKSTLIRAAIDAFLKGSTDEGLRLDRFRAAARAAAGSARYLPDGKSYVEELRALDVRRQDAIERRRRA